ncbi:MAG: hypothetical protein HYS87_01165 [Candidatus Colwellbacteria bacterium]|nr:hypothetical protein [Candidatus Colwellbacteria bacterium]
MDNNKILEVIAKYREMFERKNIPKKEFPLGSYVLADKTSILAHCHNMLDDMERFVKEGRRSKAFRWLGFIQGCLWSTDIYTVEQMANQNRP